MLFLVLIMLKYKKDCCTEEGGQLFPAPTGDRTRSNEFKLQNYLG